MIVDMVMGWIFSLIRGARSGGLMVGSAHVRRERGGLLGYGLLEIKF